MTRARNVLIAAALVATVLAIVGAIALAMLWALAEPTP